MQSLARLSPVAIVTSADSAAVLPEGAARTISVDPLGQLMTAVPVWHADDVPLSVAVGFKVDPAGSVVLAGGAVVSLERATAIWQAPLPEARPSDVSGVDVSADAALAFGRDWALVWQLVDGASLFTLDSILPQLSTDDGPGPLVHGWLLDEPRRLLIVFGSGAGRHAAVIDLASGEVIRRARLADTRALSTGISPDRATMLVGTPARLSLWDTTALTVVATLERQASGRRLPWGAFAETGEYVATAVRYPEGLAHHVVVWQVRTAQPIGQCLAGSAIDIVLGRSGRTVIAGGYDRGALTRCQPPSAGASRARPRFRERLPR